jgi:hypothetical protein
MHRNGRTASIGARKLRRGVTLWFWWVFASAAGSACVAGLWIALGTALPVLAGRLLLLLCAGAVFAVPQWLVLRAHVQDARRWLVATGFGALVAALLGLMISLVVGGTVIAMLIRWEVPLASPAPLQWSFYILGAGAVGAILGLFQWSSLRRWTWRHELRRAKGAWLVASAVGMVFLLAPVTGIFSMAPWLPEPVARMGVHGAAYGAITGLALAWLLRPRPAAEELRP